MEAFMRKYYAEYCDGIGDLRPTGWLLRLMPRASQVAPSKFRKVNLDSSWRRRWYEDILPLCPLPAYKQYVCNDDHGFSYQSLPGNDHIRLLELNPAATTEAVIECTLTTHPIQEHPPYEALSYTWGAPQPEYIISCDRKPLPIGENLWRALHRLRRENEERVLWIDAVCINQADKQEQGSQVSLMKQIYQEADGVVVWLGDETKTSPLGFDLLHRIANSPKVLHAAQSQRSILVEDMAEAGLPAPYSQDWKAIDAIFWRAWYSRVWIIQEITLARRATVICGREKLAWNDLINAASLLNKSGLIMLVDVDPAPALTTAGYANGYHAQNNNSSSGSNSGLPLLSLLVWTRASQATQRVDKVYGLLGLSQDASALGIQPDYTISATELYIKIAVQHLSTGSLDVLSAVTDEYWRTRSNLPTWVPDWSTQTRAAPYAFYGQPVRAHAADTQAAELRFSGADDRVLHASGYVVDSVARVCEPNTPARIRRDDSPALRLGGRRFWSQVLSVAAVRRVRQWERVALGLRSYPTGEPTEEVYHRSLIAGQFCEAPPDVLKGFYDAFMRYTARYPFGEGFILFGERDPERAEGYEAAMAYFLDVDRATFGRALFTTKLGYMGIGPRSTWPGDRVAVLLGGRTPYVLRSAWGGKFKFVGECFVHGLMQGEAARMGKPKVEVKIV
ncbi:uncharacterized protein K452DRAFT_253498 [Aplosporella prunicola CBS 121167]|uniref:Heterokaryon incompatibility domain-containing protein n=1 Tax=Aplosporella prunicola CBS 121167 TaxID=1176127 RepID=A0A6A6B995_9PEZI|nr:uncharacterized protein K452DRAFT_253498 [Aplosporella prunicola CBS 121167]KAF2139895.1 hypothetical protein K452DRAFT_253498 [Aplosporella prunicola CBS 121167]